MNTKQKNSHALFFAVLLMTLLIVGTVVVYFLVLPKTAPKHLTLAVLPFDGPLDIPTHLKETFPKQIAEELSRSRDVVVVDFEESQEAIELGESFRGFTQELGATHFVDGNFVESDQSPDQYVLNARLVNVVDTAWKLRWQGSFEFSNEILLEIRNHLIAGIRDGLYDKSAGEPVSVETISTTYELYLEAQNLYDKKQYAQSENLAREALEQEANPYAAHLMSVLRPLDAEYFIDLALKHHSQHHPSLVSRAKLQYFRDRNVSNYLETLTYLTSEYPNSDAVLYLSELYHALGWYEEQQQLLFRWVRMRPRSGEAALRLAFSRYRIGDREGTEHALDISESREPENVLSARYRTLYDVEIRGQPFPVTNDPNLEIRRHADQGNLDEARKLMQQHAGQFTPDEIVELALCTGDIEVAFEHLTNASNYWMRPPGWWTDDDSRWVLFISDKRYVQHLTQIGFDEPSIANLQPSNVEELFASRRTTILGG